MMRLILCLSLALSLAKGLQAQKKVVVWQDSVLWCDLRLQIPPAKEELTYAKFYQQTREIINPVLLTQNKDWLKWGMPERFETRYDSAGDYWTARVPFGLYMVLVQHPGYKRIYAPMYLNKFEQEMKFFLEGDSIMPHTYLNGRRTEYIRGVLDFSETIIVYGRPEAAAADCMAFLMENLPTERIQKLRGGNHFLVTIKTRNEESLQSMLHRQKNDIPEIWFGYMIGEQLSRYMDIILDSPLFRSVEPTFFKEDERKFLNPDDYAKTKPLQRKIEAQMQEGVLLTSYLNREQKKAEAAKKAAQAKESQKN